jgi:hypothetical protein
MSLTNPNKPVTESRLQEFYHRIKNYLGFTEMPSEDMSEVISPLPSVQPRYHKYSTEEHIVGEWIDGSKIYEKTINFGALPNNTYKYVEHNISNLASVVNVTGVGIDGTNSIPILFCWTDTINSVVAVYVDGNNIVVGAGMDRSSYTAYITIQYTKTTD